MEKREKKVSFSQFQKLGKVLMTPVMILPIAGILVGIGSAFTTKNIVALWPVLGNTYVKLFFNLLKAMGNTVNSYLPIIFAVSVAIGYAEKEKGIAALSSVIGFLAMNNVMNILLTSLGILDPAAMKTGQSMVMGIASLDTGVFGGILVGLLVAKLHNKYYNIQLPPVLGIFSGTKFVPMISLLACSALGLVMSVVWPFVQTGLGFMGEIIYDTGMAGSVIYGLAERALLPFGLRGADDRGFDTLLGRMFLDGYPDSDAPAGFAAIGTPVDGNPNPYLRAYQEDFAARAQWCAHEPAACSHPAYVAEVMDDRSATAGERVALAASIVDPDGRGFDAHWDVAIGPSNYAGAQDLPLWQDCATDATFTVPADAQPGDRFVLTLTVQTHAKRPCTRYAQVAITVA